MDFATIKAALDALTAAAKKTANVEVMDHVRQVHEIVLDVWGQITNERDLRVRIEEKLRLLEAQQAERATLLLGKSSYWQRTASGTYDGPFCTNCQDGSRKLIRFVELSASFREIGTHMCPACKTTVSPRPPES